MADDPCPKTPLTRFPLYTTTCLVGVVMISLGPVLDPILADLDIPLAQGGLISVAFAVGMLIGVVLLNFVLAHVPVKWGLIGAAWLQTVALAASGLLAHNLWSLFIAYLFVGLGCVSLNSLPGMWISSNIKANTSHAMVILLLFFAIGMMVAPIVIGLALGWGATWRWVFVFEAMLSLILAVTLTAMPVSNICGRENLRWRQLRDVVGSNPRLFTSIVVAIFLYVGAEFILNVWLAKFTIDTFETSKRVASQAVALFWAGLVIGRLMVIPLTKRVLTSRLLMVGTVVMAVFALGIALSTSLAMVMGAALGRVIFPYVVGPIAHSLGFRTAIGLAFVLAMAVSLLSLYLHKVSGEGEAAT